MSLSPAKSCLAAADSRGNVAIYDTGSWERVSTFAGADAALAWSPDGHRLYGATKTGQIRRWSADATQRTELGEVPSGLHAICVSKDGATLFLGSEGLLSLDLTAPGQPKPIGPSTREITRTLALSPDGRLLASAGHGGVILLIDTRDMTPRGELREKALTMRNYTEAGLISGLVWNASGTRLVSCDGPTIRVWDPISLDQAITLRGHASHVLAVAFSPDGRLLVSTGEDKTIRIWDSGPWSDRLPASVPVEVHARALNMLDRLLSR